MVAVFSREEVVPSGCSKANLDGRVASGADEGGVISQGETSEWLVAILAANDDDAGLIASILSDIKLDSLKAFVCQPCDLPSERVYSAILCHRQQQPTLFLPGDINASRVIVLSDCPLEQTVVWYLNNGARHFFNIHEPATLLQARIDAALRRHTRVISPSFKVGDIHFDVQKRQVTREGKPIDLSPKEYEFAVLMCSNVEKVVSNGELMTSVWSLPPDMGTRRIDTAACRVRKKLRLFNADGWELKRIRRVGYRLTNLRA